MTQNKLWIVALSLVFVLCSFLSVGAAGEKLVLDKDQVSGSITMSNGLTWKVHNISKEKVLIFEIKKLVLSVRSGNYVLLERKELKPGETLSGTLGGSGHIYASINGEGEAELQLN